MTSAHAQTANVVTVAISTVQPVSVSARKRVKMVALKTQTAVARAPLHGRARFAKLAACLRAIVKMAATSTRICVNAIA